MKIEDLADAIEDELNIYAKGSAAVVKNAVKDTANWFALSDHRGSWKLTVAFESGDRRHL